MLLLEILTAAAAFMLAGAVIAALLEWRDAIRCARSASAPQLADPMQAEAVL